MISPLPAMEASTPQYTETSVVRIPTEIIFLNSRLHRRGKRKKQKVLQLEIMDILGGFLLLISIGWLLGL